MKKIFTLCLSMMLLVGMSMQATPIASGSCGENLTWSLENGVLTIAGSGAMYDYNAMSNRAPWYNKRSQINAIVINEGLTTIGSYAFEWCGEVRTVTLPQTLTTIHRVAFAQCRKLQAITFPSNLQYIADWVLQDCESLTTLTIPAGVSHVGPQLTDECINLQTIVVEAGNTVYDSRDNCNAIIETATNTVINACRTTVIPQSVTKIGSYAFANQKLMTSVTIPNSIVSIEDHAFICAGLTAINLPASVTSISTSAFNSCNMVETITVDPANPVYEVPAGSNAITLKGRHTLFHGCPSTIIPEDIDTIGEFAFYYQNTLTSMTIPASVCRIEAYAFYYDTNMEQMTCKAVVPPSIGALNTFNFIPNDIPVYVPASSITAYQTDASWSYFTNFLPIPEDEPTGEVTLSCVEESGTCGPNLNWAVNCAHDTLLITGSGAMNDYSYSNPAPWDAHKTTITTVLLPQGLTHLGAWSLYQFEALQSIVIPEGVTSLGYVALAACRAMTSVSLPGTLQTIGGGMFSGNWNLQSLTIPASVSSIGNRLTEECTSLTSLVVEEGNTVYDSRNNCNAVIQTATNKLIAGCKVTVIPNTVQVIGTEAFANQRTMTQIKLPTSVTTLESYCFQYCGAVTDLVIPSALVYIDGSAFAGCKFNTLSVNPGNPRYDSRDNCNAIIETASNVLIKGCNTTVIPDDIVVIGEGAFWSCWNLKFINLPASVDSIGHNGLIYCKGLESITCFAVNPPALGSDAFHYGPMPEININPAIPVYVPGPSLAAYQAAPGWNYFTNFVALDSYYTVKALANHGQVTGTGTYAANATVQLVAVAEDGFVFSQWSDGSLSSTKNFVVTRDTTLRAFFEREQQEEQVIIAGQTTTMEVPEITISFEPVEEALFYELKVYLNGRLVATARIDANGQLAGDIIWAAPSRIGLRTVDTDPSVYQVNLSNLEFGKDYTFTLDTYDENEECISAQNGSFNVEQEMPTVDRAAEALTPAEPVKVLRDGRLYILLPNGTEYDAEGRVVE